MPAKDDSSSHTFLVDTLLGFDVSAILLSYTILLNGKLQVSCSAGHSVSQTLSTIQLLSLTCVFYVLSVFVQ